MTPDTSGLAGALQNMTAGQWLDVLFGVVALWCVCGGFVRGLFREVLALAAVALAFGVSGAFYRAAYAGSGVDFGLPLSGLALLAWYVILWVVTWLGVKALGWGGHWIWSRGKDEGDDDAKVPMSGRLSGGLFGALKGSVIVGFIAFTLAAFDTENLPFGDSLEGLAAQSQVVTFARENPQLLGYVKQSQLMERLNGALIYQAADGLLYYQLGLEDPAVRRDATKLVGPILERPELAQHLSASPKARTLLEALAATQAYRDFVETSPALEGLQSKPKLDLDDLRKVLLTDDAKRLLKDPEVQAVLKDTDFGAIASELRSINGDADPEQAQQPEKPAGDGPTVTSTGGDA